MARKRPLGDDELQMELEMNENDDEEMDFENDDSFLNESCSEVDDNEENCSRESDTFSDDESGDDNLIHDKMKAKDGTEWETVAKRARRVQAANIITVPPGLTNKSCHITSKLDAFKCFVTPEIVDILVKYTNQKAQKWLAEWNAAHPDKQCTWCNTDSTEMYAMIGILMIMGALHATKEQVNVLWSTDPVFKRAIFTAAIARNRFLSLLRFMRFDDFTTRDVRRETDKLAPIRDLFEMFAKECRECFNPSSHLTVDEQLVASRNRCPFRVYMKQKPHRYGIKVWVLADNLNYYVHNLQVYTGKRDGVAEKNQGQRVVIDLVSHLRQGYGITADNFFTSLDLVNDLLDRNLTYCGTVRKNKTFVPPELLPNKTKAEFSSIFGFTEKHTIVSYVPKKSKGVILLSTEHHEHSISGVDNSFKPDIILHYNATKGAVDTFDKLAAEYSVRRKTLRWPMVMFMDVIDTAGVNAFCIFSFKFPDWDGQRNDNRRRFLLELGKELVIPHVKVRLGNPVGLHSSIIADMKTLVPDYQPNPVQPQGRGPIQGRCVNCPRNRDKKIRARCERCQNFICKDHSQKVTQVTCTSCQNEQ